MCISINHSGKSHTFNLAAVCFIQPCHPMRPGILCLTCLYCNLSHLPVVQKSVMCRPSKCLQCAAEDGDSSFLRIECHSQHPGVPFLFFFLQSSHLQKKGALPPWYYKIIFNQARYRGLSFLSKLPLIHNHPSVGLLILLGVLLQARQRYLQYHPGKIPSEYPQA